MTGNVANGIYASSLSGRAQTTVTMFHSVSSNNKADGLATTGTGATPRVGQSVVSGNGGGWLVQGGVLQSYGDNYIDGNGSNTGMLGSASKQ